MVELLISLASGALGGNLAGKAMPSKSMGTLLNSVSGILGGGIGSQLIGLLSSSAGAAAASSSLDIGSILASVAGGGAGGGVLMVIVSIVKGLLSKK